MTPQEISEEFFSNSIRAEEVIHLGTQLLDYATPSAVEDAFSDDWDRIWAALDCDEPDEDETDMEGIAYYLRNQVKKQGYLVQFATPIPSCFSDSGYMFSWGCYTTHWIYAETYEQACINAVEWQLEFIEKKRKESNEAA